MVDIVVRGFLGGAGGTLLDFYQSNSLWINSAVVCYALWYGARRRSIRS